MIISAFIGGYILFVAFIGENGPKHKCIHANKCSASIRCTDEKRMKCYEEK